MAHAKEEGGTLAEAMRRRSYQVVQLDEVEKAHPDVLNVLLLMLERSLYRSRRAFF